MMQRTDPLDETTDTAIYSLCWLPADLTPNASGQEVVQHLTFSKTTTWYFHTLGSNEFIRCDIARSFVSFSGDDRQISLPLDKASQAFLLFPGFMLC